MYLNEKDVKDIINIIDSNFDKCTVFMEIMPPISVKNAKEESIEDTDSKFIWGVEKVIPVLNEKSRIKVGFIWTTIIKYILPVFLAVIWIIGIIELFMKANQFELMVDAVLIILVLVLSTIFYKKKSVKTTADNLKS